MTDATDASDASDASEGMTGDTDRPPAASPSGELRHSALVGFMSVPVHRLLPLRRSTLLMAVAFVGFGSLLYVYPPQPATSGPGAVVHTSSGDYFVPNATPVSTTTTTTTVPPATTTTTSSTTTTTVAPESSTTTAPPPTTAATSPATTSTTRASSSTTTTTIPVGVKGTGSTTSTGGA